jgi:ankyrin repeat protein
VCGWQCEGVGADDDRPPWSPIRVAVENFAFEVIEELLAAGADVNEQYPADGFSLLHLAVDAEFDVGFHAGRPLTADMTTFLLEHGADPSARDRRGETPRDMAERLGYDAAADVLRRFERSAHSR